MKPTILDYLEKASKAYYAGNPIISDEEFDALANSYDQVGVPEGQSKHLYHMYSLQKVHYGETQPTLSRPVKTPKLDGAAISIMYLDGQLYKINTRGDGKKGLDITNIIRHLVPETILDTSPVQLNAEVVAPKTIPNSRNYAAGALHLKDPEEAKSRQLEVIVYDKLPYKHATYSELPDIAPEELRTVFNGGLSEIYPLDGYVVREDCNFTYMEAGFTQKHPRAAYALKPKAQEVVTTLLGVEWNTGRSGVVTPVAILEPIIIGEATISRATLHNIEYIEMLELEIGCQVKVIRSGEIIPKIIGRI